MHITQCDISWDDREKAAQIHYLRGLWPDSEPEDDTIKEAARTMGIDIIGKKQFSCRDHRVLARVFMVRVPYDEPESAQPPDEFQSMLHDFDNCGLFAELMYDTTRSKRQCKIDI